VVDKPTDGTCEWLLKSHVYLRWLDEHGLLLIRGNPGCGKSTLLKFALQKQLEGAVSTGSLVISFFFYSSGTELQNGIIGLLRSLLLQLLEQDVGSRSTYYEICHKRWIADGMKDEKIKWHRNELQAIFERLVLECSTRRKTTIFVDAIDECRDQDLDRLIRLFHTLKGRSQIRLNRPRVCLTCRPYPDGQIYAEFRVQLEKENRDDIQNFIEQELRLPDETESAVNALKQNLQKKADGLFLWLVLVIRQVHDMSSQGLNLKMIQSEVSKCPTELDALYQGLLERIEDKELSEAGRLFQWLCFTNRPSSIDELRIALTVHLTGTKSTLAEYEDEENRYYIPNEKTMKKRMIHLSRGLADVAGSNLLDGKTLVGFYHETIKDFMIRKGLQYLNHRLQKSPGLAEIAHFELANTCIDYISIKEIRTALTEKHLTLLRGLSFLGYAATYWLIHAVAAERDGYGEHITWPTQNVLNTWVQINRILRANPTQHPEEGTTLMHIAAEHGLKTLAERIVNRRVQTLSYFE
jgi:hypothetical protein